MEASDPIPRIMRRRGGSRFRQREPRSVESRVRQQLRSNGKGQGRRKFKRNAVKNREKTRLRREAQGGW